MTVTKEWPNSLALLYSPESGTKHSERCYLFSSATPFHAQEWCNSRNYEQPSSN